MTTAVAGGTGLVGRLVVAELARRGDTPVVLARSAGVDLTTAPDWSTPWRGWPPSSTSAT